MNRTGEEGVIQVAVVQLVHLEPRAEVPITDRVVWERFIGRRRHDSTQVRNNCLHERKRFSSGGIADQFRRAILAQSEQNHLPAFVIDY